MSHLLKAEIYRIKCKKIFYLAVAVIMFIALFSVMSAESADINETIDKSLTYGTIILPLSFILIYLYVWQADFSSRFINNILISGVSRSNYFIAKLFIIYTMGIIMVISYSFPILFFSCISQGVLFSHIVVVVMVQMLLYLVVLTMGLMIYILVDSVALSTTVYLLFVLLSENLISSLLNQIGFNVKEILKYFIFQNLSKTISIYDLDISERYPIVIGGLLLLAVSFSISMRMLKNKEFK